MKKVKLISIFVIALLLFQCKKKDNESIPNFAQIAQDCIDNQFTDSLQIANNLIGAWDLIDFEACKNCIDKFPPFIILVFRDSSGIMRIDRYDAEEEKFTEFVWFLSPGSGFSNYYYKIKTAAYLPITGITVFCEDYMSLGYFTNGDQYLYKKRN